VGRGERPWGRRGGEGYTGRGVRGSYDERWEPDQELDPYRYPRDDDDDLGYTTNDDCIWPVIEDEEDD
jgi:hypothetical protein